MHACVRLEVQAHYDLDHAATDVVGGRQILIGNVGLSECPTGKTSETCTAAGSADFAALAAKLEVDVVESVQELAAHFKVHRLSDLNLLHQTDVETRQSRAIQNEV